MVVELGPSLGATTRTGGLSWLSPYLPGASSAVRVTWQITYASASLLVRTATVTIVSHRHGLRSERTSLSRRVGHPACSWPNAWMRCVMALSESQYACVSAVAQSATMPGRARVLHLSCETTNGLPGHPPASSPDRV